MDDGFLDDDADHQHDERVSSVGIDAPGEEKRKNAGESLKPNRVAGKVPVAVLSGPLGSGKATLRNHILKAHHGKRIAVNKSEFGEIGIDDATACESIVTAWLGLSGKAIHTAWIYGTEDHVCKTVVELGANRSELFILSKIPGCADAKGFVNKDLTALGTDHIDILLIHSNIGLNCQATCKQLEEFHESGVLRAIGVRNFDAKARLKILGVAIAPVKPAVNQVKINVLSHDDDTIESGKADGITPMSYSPLEGDATQLSVDSDAPNEDPFADDALAVAKSDDAVPTLGDARHGGSSIAEAAQLAGDVEHVAVGTSAVTALKNLGDLLTRGLTAEYGGDSSAAGGRHSSDEQQVAAGGHAMAALRSAGAVLTWGDADKCVQECRMPCSYGFSLERHPDGEFGFEGERFAIGGGRDVPGMVMHYCVKRAVDQLKLETLPGCVQIIALCVPLASS